MHASTQDHVRHAVADFSQHTPRRTALRVLGPLGVALAGAVGLDVLSTSAKGAKSEKKKRKVKTKPGPPGPPGPRGPQGPPDTTVHIVSERIIGQNAETVPTTVAAAVTASAQCGGPFKVSGGGFDLNGAESTAEDVNTITVITSRPSASNGWEAVAQRTAPPPVGAGTVTIVAWVECVALEL